MILVTIVILTAFLRPTGINVLPAFENADDTFKIPNTEDGGSWQDFDPREQVESFQNSNGNTSNLTRELTKILKNWVRNTSTLTYKSYILVNDVMDFLSDSYPNGKGKNKYENIVQNFFIYKKNRLSSIAILTQLLNVRIRLYNMRKKENTLKPQKNGGRYLIQRCFLRQKRMSKENKKFIDFLLHLNHGVID